MGIPPAIKERGKKMNLKYLSEQHSENQEKMQKILDTAKLEKRALSKEEIAKFNELKKLIDEIDATIKAEDEARKMDMQEKEEEKQTEGTEDSGKEERAFVDFIATGEERANSPGMSYGSNGAIVPTTIAKKIIEKVKELSPIYEKVEKFHTSGTLEIKEGALVIGFPQSENQADSTATTVADLKSDFNSLLSKLKSSELMEDDES